MASEKILAQKQGYVDALKAKIEESGAGVVFNYGGITVADDTKLRKELREAGVSYEVVKNTLLKIALKGTAFEGMSDCLEGSTAIAFSNDEDPIAAARILYKFAKDSKDKFAVKAGYIDGEVLDRAGVAQLATLPNREGLLSMLLSALNGNLSGLARALDAVREKKEGEVA